MGKMKKAWSWIPTLYFAEGLPYVTVMTIAVIMYKRLGLSNAEIAFYTGWLYLPWVIKPIWSPFVDLLQTKRYWIVLMQLLIGASLAGVAFTLTTDWFVQASLACFWLMAFSSATHDIAADGFYMLGLDKGEQSFFIGIRNIFYRVAMVFGQGFLVMCAGYLEKTTGTVPMAWALLFYFMAAIFLFLSLYHYRALPVSEEDRVVKISGRSILKAFLGTFYSFFRKPGIGIALLFMLTYRLAESQLVKIVSPFMLDAREAGGLGLSTISVGSIYGTVGVVCLMFGGILGGLAIARKGFGYWLWPMVVAINLPDLVYLYMALAQPDSILIVYLSVALEQFGYGFGFTAYTMYLILFAEGEHKTAHYAICTAFMAIGMMLPGMLAGWLQNTVGYVWFFVWVCCCTVPGFLLIPFLKIPDCYGMRKNV